MVLAWDMAVVVAVAVAAVVAVAVVAVVAVAVVVAVVVVAVAVADSLAGRSVVAEDTRQEARKYQCRDNSIVVRHLL
jgi:hypothetical protein